MWKEEMRETDKERKSGRARRERKSEKRESGK